MNRFGGSFHAARRNLPLWHLQLFERTVLAIESGMLKGKQIVDRFRLKPNESENFQEQGGPTSSRRLQLEDRGFRSALGNSIVCSVLTLHEGHYQQVVRAVVVVAAVLDRLHAEQNRCLRSVEASAEWIVGQVSSDYAAHVEEFLALLTPRSAMQEAGLSLPADSGHGSNLKRGQDNELEVGLDDEQAELFGQLVLSFMTQRIVRCLWLYGWPANMLCCLAPDELAESTIQSFQADEEIFRALTSKNGLTSAEQLVQKRHVLQMRANMQFQAAFQDTGYVHSDGLKEVLGQRARGNLATQLIEDMNGEQKNHSQLKSCRRFRRPSTSWAVCLEKNIISERHSYKEVELDAPLLVFEAHLPNVCYKLDKDRASMDFSPIASSSSGTSWWSPSASNLNVPTADLSMLSFEYRSGQFDQLHKAFLGEVCSFSHKLIIGSPTGVANKTEWMLALDHFPKSAAVLWPIDPIKIVGTKLMCVALRTGLKEPVLRPILSLQGLRAATLVWRSWSWQRIHTHRPMPQR